MDIDSFCYVPDEDIKDIAEKDIDSYRDKISRLLSYEPVSIDSLVKRLARYK